MLRRSRPARNSVHGAAALVVAAALVTLAACASPIGRTTLVSANGPASATSQAVSPLIFDAEFNATTVGSHWYPNRWFATSCAPGATSGESQFYTRSRVAVSGGYLRLTARGPAQTCTEGSWAGTRAYSSGWVQTGGASTDTGLKVKPGFTFRYGHVDVRFKEPAGKGLWPGIWLAADGRPGAPQTYPWPPEIDLLESYGNPSIWSFHVHLAGGINSGKDVVGPNTATGFHTVSLDWRRTRITWSIDGKVTHSYTGPNIPQVPMYLIVNLATGGVAGAPDASRLPATMLVDWIHVRA